MELSSLRFDFRSLVSVSNLNLCNFRMKPSALVAQLAFLVSALANPNPGSYHKPWATHAGCASIVRRFDWQQNTSEPL